MLIAVLKHPYNSLLILSLLTFYPKKSFNNYSSLKTLIIDSSIRNPNQALNLKTLNILKGSSEKVFKGSNGVLIILSSKSLKPT